ncbi:5-hydroxytryptamine receptor 3A-like [Halichoeres trimaculatus]|uniref:5-hydroxytryptamine receptor 3A-like n=1 Tax=Halichoeres trimaculatus TaxID=147232 RepID=UPI003D9F0CE7
MFAGFLFLLLLTGGSSSNHTQPPDSEGLYNQSHLEGGNADSYSEPVDGARDDDSIPWKSDWPDHCTDVDVINHLNLTDKVKFYLARPIQDNKRSINLTLDIHLYSILDVKEKEQELVAYFWIDMFWKNEFIEWKARDFCRTYGIIVPAELLWKPDLTIEEVTIKDKLFNTQYLTVRFNGGIYQRSGMVLVSTCKMDFYRFPFDTQICNLTFKSIQHPSRQMKLLSRLTNNDILSFTRDSMKTESEWLLMNVTVDTSEVYNFGFHLSVLVYTMTIKRRSVLYVANFIVPVLFFLCLDLASFLISESGGEKLSFKVTVLLAVTVMQLILNDILPSSSDRIPLIAVYCIGVFTLMMLSLLETILMMYLMEKDHVSQDQEADKDQSLDEDCRDQAGKVHECFRDMNKSIPCVRVFDQSPAGMPPELLPGVKEGSSSQLTQEIQDFQSLNNELREVLKTVVLLLSSRKEEKEPGYWTTKTKTLNRIYFIVYLLAASVFLVSVFSVWLHEDR